MRKMLMKLRKDQKGQGMVEYGIIIALVALVAIVAMQALGTNITARFQEAANTIGGAADGGVLAALNIGLCPGATTTPITVPVVAPVVAGTVLTVQVGTAAAVVVTAGGTFDLPITTVPGNVVLTYNLGPNLATVTQTVNLTTNDVTAPVLTCPAATPSP